MLSVPLCKFCSALILPPFFAWIFPYLVFPLTSLVAPIIQFLHDAVDFTREGKRNGFASGFQFSLVHWCGPNPFLKFFSPLVKR
jgi:hypothetical protein